MLQQLVWAVHMFCALCIIILVLLQHGKGAELGASLGGASQTIFGSQGTSSFLTKLTTIFALLFAITSISLSFFINQKNQNLQISDIIKQKQQQTLPKNNIEPQSNNDTELPD